LSTRKVALPEELRMGHTLAGVLEGGWVWDDCSAIRVCALEGPLKRIEPGPLVMLAAWSDELRSRGVKIVIDDSLKSRYAFQVGLLGVLAGSGRLPPPMQHHFSPRRVGFSEEISECIDGFKKAMGLQGEGVAQAISKLISEGLRNVFDHANAPRGAFLCGQYIPEPGRSGGKFVIAIADTGLGAVTHIRRKYGEGMTEVQAAHLATQARISGAPPIHHGVGSAPANNAGLGLFYMQNISFFSRGEFYFFTGQACVRGEMNDLFCEARDFPIETLSLETPWKGTALALSVDRDFGQNAVKATMRMLEKTTRPESKYQRVNWNPAPEEAVRYAISSDQSGFWEDKGIAAKVRNDLVLPALKSSLHVELDLRGIKTVSHSCIHTLLYQAVFEHHNIAKSLLHIRAKSKDVKNMVRLVTSLAYEDAQRLSQE
jgi:hypothetical protein